jgi:hypothetical protein
VEPLPSPHQLSWELSQISSALDLDSMAALVRVNLALREASQPILDVERRMVTDVTAELRKPEE